MTVFLGQPLASHRSAKNIFFDCFDILRIVRLLLKFKHYQYILDKDSFLQEL